MQLDTIWFDGLFLDSHIMNHGVSQVSGIMCAWSSEYALILWLFVILELLIDEKLYGLVLVEHVSICFCLVDNVSFIISSICSGALLFFKN